VPGILLLMLILVTDGSCVAPLPHGRGSDRCLANSICPVEIPANEYRNPANTAYGLQITDKWNPPRGLRALRVSAVQSRPGFSSHPSKSEYNRASVGSFYPGIPGAH
jgi:hypothetical protein